jgi:hypothetical protein
MDAENRIPLSWLIKKSAISLSLPSSFVITSPSMLLLYRIFFEIGIAGE